MNREFLQNLGLEKEVIEKIMAEHGKTIQELKPAQEELEELKNDKAALEKQLTELQSTLSTKENELKSLDELKKEVEAYKLKDLKTKIAIQAGIPELAGRLSGSTEEEIKADAEKLAELIPSKKPTLPLKPTEPQNVDPKEKAYEKLLENL